MGVAAERGNRLEAVASVNSGNSLKTRARQDCRVPPVPAPPFQRTDSRREAIDCCGESDCHHCRDSRSRESSGGPVPKNVGRAELAGHAKGS